MNSNYSLSILRGFKAINKTRLVDDQRNLIKQVPVINFLVVFLCKERSVFNENISNPNYWTHLERREVLNKY